MTSIYKQITENDIAKTTTNLHEFIPITGAVTSGTYGTFPSGTNVKYFSHNQWVDIYDYAYTSSSANHLFSMTAGVFSGSVLHERSLPSIWDNRPQAEDKLNIMRQFAQQYMGYNQSQEVIPFNISGTLTPFDSWQHGGWDPGATKIDSMVFIDFSRVLMKDEIKKGSFQITLKTGSWVNTYYKGYGSGGSLLTLSDAHATDTTGYKDNSPMGQYGLLKSGTGATVPATSQYGFIFYQAGLLALNASDAVWGEAMTSGTLFSPEAAQECNDAMTSSSIENIVNGARASILNIQFNNTTELFSTLYFCRANANEFNYSSNPSFTSASKIEVKNVASDPSVTYPTTVGLYSPDNELLAVGKLSEPLKKRSDTEFTLRVRLDY